MKTYKHRVKDITFGSLHFECEPRETKTRKRTEDKNREADDREATEDTELEFCPTCAQKHTDIHKVS